MILFGKQFVDRSVLFDGERCREQLEEEGILWRLCHVRMYDMSAQDTVVTM